MKLRDSSYLCPVETYDAAQRALLYVQKRALVSRSVSFICLKSELAFLLRQRYPSYRWFALEDIPEAWQAARGASVVLSDLEPQFIEQAERSPFFWSVLSLVHSEFLLHLVVCIRIVEALLSITTQKQTFILVPTGLLFGYRFERFGERNPLFIAVLRDYLERTQRPYELCGGAWWIRPTILAVVELLRITGNVVLFFIGIIVDVLLGVLHGVVRVLRTVSFRSFAKTTGGGVLIFSREALEIVSLAELRAAARREHAAVTYADFENLYVRFSLADLFRLAIKCLRLLIPQQGRLCLGRLDPRQAVSRMFFFFVHPVAFRAFGGMLRCVVRLPREIVYTRRAVRTLCGALVFKKLSVSLSMYLDMFVGGLAVEYLFSWLATEVMVQHARPTTVVYPDGYSVLVRLLHWRAWSGDFVGVQVPHGSPNKTIPSYWYRASFHAAPTILDERHLRRYRIIDRSAIISVSSGERLERVGSTVSHESFARPTLALVYTGTLAYWSYPSFFRELWVLSGELIEKLLAAFPEGRIILKSHPNGTSFEFFQGVLSMFSVAAQRGRVVHVSEGWSKREQYMAVDVGFSFLTFPSTPFIHFATAGVPLLIIAGIKKAEHLLYYPTVANIFDFPWLFDTSEQAIAEARRILSSVESWQSAQRMMLQYAAPLQGHRKEVVNFAQFVAQQAKR